jgi:preprotein translocase subunit YajC
LVKQAEPLIFLALVAVVMWLFLVRPARRRQQQMQGVQRSVAPGTEVMLGSGIYGKAVSVDDQTIELEVAPGTTLKVARAAVVRILDEEPPQATTPDEHETEAAETRRDAPADGQ